MTRTIAIVTIAALLSSGTALAYGHRAAGRMNHGTDVQAQAGAALGPGAQAGLANHAGQGQGGQGQGGLVAARLEGVVAGALGLTQDELHALKLEGATIADIAAERGTPIDTVEAAYLTARADAVQELLGAGAISELQAERMAARGPEAFAELLARDTVGQGRNAGGTPGFAHRDDAAGAGSPGPRVAATPGPRVAGAPGPHAATASPRGGHGGRW